VGTFGFVPREEVSILYPQQKFHFMRELCGCDGGVSATDCEVRAVGVYCSQKVTVCWWCVGGGESMSKAVFAGIAFEVDVY
jgi:hypothetical protein